MHVINSLITSHDTSSCANVHLTTEWWVLAWHRVAGNTSFEHDVITVSEWRAKNLQGWVSPAITLDEHVNQMLLHISKVDNFCAHTIISTHRQWAVKWNTLVLCISKSYTQLIQYFLLYITWLPLDTTCVSQVNIHFRYKEMITYSLLYQLQFLLNLWNATIHSRPAATN